MAPRSFKKLVIAVSGTFPGYKQADLKTIIEEKCGASFASTVTDECTHLITTEKEVERKGAKFKQASDLPKCSIVSLKWLIESGSVKKPLPEQDYLLGSDSGPNNASKNGTKYASNGDKTSGIKRGPSEEKVESSQEKPNKKLKDGQKAISKSLKVEVDEACNLKASYEVFIDDSGLIWDATLNQTNAANNNNKFYRIQLLRNGVDHKTWTRWGRVGEFGQSAILGDGSLAKAKADFEKKFKDKSGLKWDDRLNPPKKGKYTFIEKNYEEDEEEEHSGKGKKNGKKEVASTLPQPVQNLMAFIFNQDYFLSAMASMSYDAQKLPLGKLSKRTLTSGYQILKDLAELIAQPNLARTTYGSTFNTAAEDLSNRYFTTIPHAFGRNRPPVLNTDAQIKKEIDLLEALSDMEVANGIMKESNDDMVNQLDRQFQGLGLKEMTPLDRNSAEFQGLESYLVGTHGATHCLRYSIIDIFRIERAGEKERFMASEFSKLDKEKSDRRLLWHGSRSTNYGGILSQGLRIAPPEAPVSGYMFGKGVYFADMSSKSANYCWAHISANMGLLLLCEVELGNPLFEQANANYNAGMDARRNGSFSTLGLGSTAPPTWRDASCVHPDLAGVKMPDPDKAPPEYSGPHSLMYNEYIVYDVAQIRQRYLFHVHMS